MYAVESISAFSPPPPSRRHHRKVRTLFCIGVTFTFRTTRNTQLGFFLLSGTLELGTLDGLRTAAKTTARGLSRLECIRALSEALPDVTVNVLRLIAEFVPNRESTCARQSVHETWNRLFSRVWEALIDLIASFSSSFGGTCFHATQNWNSVRQEPLPMCHQRSETKIRLYFATT